MINDFKKFWSLLTPRGKQSAIKLLFVVLLAAASDVLGVASIMPFIAVLSQPSLVDENQYLAEANNLAVSLGFISEGAFFYS